MLIGSLDLQVAGPLRRRSSPAHDHEGRRPNRLHYTTLPASGKADRGSAEHDANAMRLPIIDEPDAEIAGQGNPVDLD